ncbi:retrotransposon protein, putative, ty1-copia subclass [Tanacetum coccineum]
MEEEMDSLRKNKTWELVDHPAGQKLVSCIWLFRIKEGIEGVQKPRYKARLVARGFTQRASIDYNEVFSPIVRHTSIQVILALTACKDYELEHLDVKTAFLHGNLEEVIYMKQPPGYEQGNKIGSTKSLLKKEFDMKELGEANEDSWYGDHNGKSVKMPLSRHFKLSLKDCSVKDYDVERMSKVPYANAVGSLMYLMVCTWPDIEYAVSVVSRYLANLGKNHWGVVKWILKYLRGTANVGLVYGTNRGNHVDVRGFVDSDYANDLDKGRKMLKSKTTMKNPTSQHAENYSLHSYATNQPTFYRDHQTQPPLPVEFSSKSLKVSVDRGHFLEGVERLFSAWATRKEEVIPGLARLYLVSGCSYHMTPRLDILFDFLKCDGGSVQLGDNRECKIKSIDKVRVQLKDGRAKSRRLMVPGLFYPEYEGIIAYTPWMAMQWQRYGLYSSGSNTTAFESQKSAEEISRGYGRDDGFKEAIVPPDNGLEFCNQEFELLCIESGIARHLTVAGTPQQNGVAEHMNKTLMDKVRYLLIQSRLPKTFWAERQTSNGPIYLFNTSHRERLRKVTYGGCGLGHPSLIPKCVIEMLRIFCCVAYLHDKQGKLEPRAIKCVLLGYLEGVKGYRLYRLDGELHKIVIRRNVVFNESVMYKDTLKDSGADQEDGDDEDAGDHETDQTPDLTDYQLARDRERRTRTKPLRFQDESNMAAYAFAAAEEEDTHEPLTYQEAVACEDSSKWKAAMEEEMDSLRKNKTWELVDHPAGQKLVSCKWLFKIKEGIEGVQKPRYKARLVARGFTQRAGIDYNEVFSPVVRHTSIRVILALTACKDYELEQLDVKTAFLHGNLEEVIYMKQPPGYEQGNKVCLLKKSLYGLKQSPRQWYRRFDEYMLSNGFKRSSYDSCIGSTKSLLKKEFDMKELGEAKEDSWYGDRQGSESQDSEGVTIRDCSVKDCDVERMSKVPYANAVGSLIYLMVCMWPDIEKMLKSKTTMKNPTSQHAENYSLHSYAMNQPTFYRDHQTQPPLPVEFSLYFSKV